jgi:hypothetical protein
MDSRFAQNQQRPGKIIIGYPWGHNKKTTAVKLSLFPSTTACRCKRSVMVKLHAFLTLTWEGGKWFALCSGYFILRKEPFGTIG